MNKQRLIAISAFLIPGGEQHSFLLQRSGACHRLCFRAAKSWRYRVQHGPYCFRASRLGKAV